MAKVGADANITPREIIREYISLLDILLQNPNATFESVVGSALSRLTAVKTDEEDEFADMEI